MNSKNEKSIDCEEIYGVLGFFFDLQIFNFWK